MTGKRVLIAVATLANALAVVLPGGAIVWEAVGDIGVSRGRLGPWGWVVSGLFGLAVMAVGGCNIMGVQLAFFEPGRWQRVAYRLGLVSCAVMVGGIAVGLVLVEGSLWLGPQTIAALLTVLALQRVSPQEPLDWRCETCGYDLRGLPTTVCPECGDGASNAGRE